jgi:linoleoyl-CoA desaturase
VEATSERTRAGVTFPPHSPLRAELNRRVDAYFRTTGKRRDGGGRLVLKSATVLLWLVASYVFLVFLAANWWQAGLGAVSLSLAVAGVGFNIQHDGGHDAYSRRRVGNWFAAFALDLVGGSSYIWRFKHAGLHHHFTNLDGVDEDIDSAPFLRLAPTQRRRVGSQPMPKPRTRDVAFFSAGKLAFVGWVFVLPLVAGHSVGVVLGFYGLCALVTGIAMAVVFQLAHCVEEAEFPVAPARGGRVALPWFEHQLATTVDFAPRNRFLTWYLGGLNFQVEHHLYPHISHVHYPALAPIVGGACREFGVRHRVHRGFWPAIASHVRHMRRLGRP